MICISEIKFKALFLFALFSSLLVLQQPSYAQDARLAYAELDKFVDTTKDDYYAKSEEFERNVDTDSLLTHKFRLPKGWSDITGESKMINFASDVGSTLAKFVGPPNMFARSKFEIKVIPLKREVDLIHWYYTYVIGQGNSVTAMEVMRDGRRVEAEAINISHEATFVVRSVAMVSGDRVIVAEYSVPDPFWKEQRDEAVWSISTFDMVFTDDRTIEPRKEFSILDIVKFVYPSSWQIRVPKLTVVDELSSSATSRNERGELDGRMDMFFIASHVEGTREENLANYKEKYKKVVSFDFGEHVETIESSEYDKTITAGRMDVFNAITIKHASETGYEIWMALLESDVYDGYVFMATVGRDVDFMTWSKNQRTFKILVESMELHGQAR